MIAAWHVAKEVKSTECCPLRASSAASAWWHFNVNEHVLGPLCDWCQKLGGTLCICLRGTGLSTFVCKEIFLHKGQLTLCCLRLPHTRQVSCWPLLMFIIHDERKPTCIQGGSFSKHRPNGIPQPRKRPTTCTCRKSSMLRQLLSSRLMPESARWRLPWRLHRLPKALLK